MILKNINLNVTENCILGILGNNGAGKTTLFKTIVGLHQKFIGQIKVFDTDISTDKSFLNRVGFIPDISQIPGWYRGIDFLNLYLRLKGVDDIENRIRENITKFSLKDKINQRINTYSKGQKKRLLLAKVFAESANLYILDEPFEGLDIKNRQILKAEILKEYSSGCCIIISSHEIHQIKNLCTHIVTIQEGNVSKINEKNADFDYELQFMS